MLRKRALRLTVYGSLAALGVSGVSALTARPVHPVSEPPIAGRQPDPPRVGFSFEPNVGQAESRVRFLARSPSSTVWLTADEIVVAVPRPGQATRPPTPSRPHDDPNATGVDRVTARRRPGADRAAVLHMVFHGAARTPRMTGEGPLAGRAHDLHGRDATSWRTAIPTYARVRYREMYPGIDVVVHGDARRLEYDFVVAPGADPEAIQISLWTGAEGARPRVARIDAAGKAVVDADGGAFVLGLPRSFQKIGHRERDVGGRFALNGQGRLVLRMDWHDNAQPLVVDPVVSFSSYLGGSGEENHYGDTLGGDIARDAAGKLYLTGITLSADFPVTPGAFQTSHANPLPPPDEGEDVFVTKLDPAGNVVYSTYVGGSGRDLGRAIGVDHDGNAYVTGRTFSRDFPTRDPLQPRFGGGVSDAFVFMLDAAGADLVYSTYLGGSGDDWDFGMDVDASGAAYVTGRTFSDDFPTTPGAYDTACGTDGRCNRNDGKTGGCTLQSGECSSDTFVTKVAPGGTAFAYSTYVGGSGHDWGLGIRVDDSGAAYLAGQTESTDLPTKNALQPAYGGGILDAIVAKLEPNGAAIAYATYLGGSGHDAATGVAVDASHHAYLTGLTTSDDFPARNAFQPALAGGRFDAFVSKIAIDGSTLEYSSYLGGTDTENVFLGPFIAFEGLGGIAVDSSGVAYVTGYTASRDFPGATRTGRPGPDDLGQVFVAKVDPSGTRLGFSRLLGGSNMDAGSGIVIDDAGNAYVTGMTASGDFPTERAFQPRFGSGGFDAFVLAVPTRSRRALTPAKGVHGRANRLIRPSVEK